MDGEEQTLQVVKLRGGETEQTGVTIEDRARRALISSEGVCVNGKS